MNYIRYSSHTAVSTEYIINILRSEILGSEILDPGAGSGPWSWIWTLDLTLDLALRLVLRSTSENLISEIYRF